jgi:Lrp/AsnC family transcriptional regulator, leucine-responsive regulatory protein
VAAGFAPAHAAATIAMVASGFFLGGMRPILSALVADLTETETRRAAFSLSYLGVNIGVALGLLMAGWLFTLSLQLVDLFGADGSPAYGLVWAVNAVTVADTAGAPVVHRKIRVATRGRMRDLFFQGRKLPWQRRTIPQRRRFVSATPVKDLRNRKVGLTIRRIFRFILDDCLGCGILSREVGHPERRQDMDDTDRRIVDLLLADGRMTHEQIAKEVHLSRPAVFERVKRLEAKGVIHGYTARVDWEALGLPLTAFIWIRTNNVDCNDSGRLLAQVQFEGAKLEDLYRVIGDWCMFARYRVASPSVLQQVLDRLRQMPGVQNTLTSIALSTIEESRTCNGHASLAGAGKTPISIP